MEERKESEEAVLLDLQPSHDNEVERTARRHRPSPPSSSSSSHSLALSLAVASSSSSGSGSSGDIGHASV